ncbi:hypothetical protein COU76_05605, partial [Candidatus Peregrinibacteria bacterium CG10_big_fil_rev_8_21_14_0_10_49_10]
MPLADTDIGKILVEQSYLSEEELNTALLEAKDQQIPLIEILTEQGLISQNLVQSALAEHYKLEYFDLQSHPPGVDTIFALPEAVARKYYVIVVQKDEKSITVAASDPQQEHLEEIIRMNLNKQEAYFTEEETDGKKEKNKDEKNEEKKGKEKQSKPKKKKKSGGGLFGLGKKEDENADTYKGKITYVYASKEGIEAMFLRYRKPLATRFQQIVDAEKEVAPEILDEIINDAIQLRASDIHFEPQGEKLSIVRFRVDGVMHEAGRIPKIYYEGVVNLIKIESNMRIDEHFAPQDGAIRHSAPDGSVTDIRVSIVPVVDGEKVVMRLLASYVSRLTLNALGFSKENQETLEAAAHKPFGMLLTTGPTGSGKSTTLYALIILRNTPDVNISTIEDPVEYKIAGINHIQANPEANLTFATGLRALVRQDPDVILVGE